MSKNMQVQRLLQAIEHFNSRTKGAQDIPKEVVAAVEGLHKALNVPPPGRNTPGSREAYAVAPGTRGAAEPFPKAARGIDGPSPGQREARSLSQEIHDAATSIAAGRAVSPS